MAALTIRGLAQNTPLDPEDPALAAASAGGDTFTNDGRTFLRAVNGSGAPITVTLNAVGDCSQGFDHDIETAVPAGEERWIGPLNTNRFGQTVAVTYSDVTNLTVAAYRVPRA